jgi:hypothetical protein
MGWLAKYASDKNSMGLAVRWSAKLNVARINARENGNGLKASRACGDKWDPPADGSALMAWSGIVRRNYRSDVSREPACKK